LWVTSGRFEQAVWLGLYALLWVCSLWVLRYARCRSILCRHVACILLMGIHCRGVVRVVRRIRDDPTVVAISGVIGRIRNDPAIVIIVGGVIVRVVGRIRNDPAIVIGSVIVRVVGRIRNDPAVVVVVVRVVGRIRNDPAVVIVVGGIIGDDFAVVDVRVVRIVVDSPVIVIISDISDIYNRHILLRDDFWGIRGDPVLCGLWLQAADCDYLAWGSFSSAYIWGGYHGAINIDGIIDNDGSTAFGAFVQAHGRNSCAC